jgi:hypothetical protein
MPGRLATRAITSAVRRTPGLRRLPVLRLLALAEVGMLARDHLYRLEPDERHRLYELVRQGRGRTRTLSAAERDELQSLVTRLEPRRFVGIAADKFSPVPLPRRMVQGPPRKH